MALDIFLNLMASSPKAHREYIVFWANSNGRKVRTTCKY